MIQEADPAHHVEVAAGLEGDPFGEPAARPDHRQGGAEEEAGGAGVGPVIDPRGVEARMVEDRHQDRRGDRQGERPEGEPGTQAVVLALVDEAQADQQDERPEDVELLLDRQRPEMVQRLFGREAGEVRHVRRDLLPVVDVEDRRDDRLAELVRLGGAEDRHPGDHDQEHQEERRQQAAGAAEPEAAQVDRALLHELAEQDVGDQVAGEGEEDADAEQPAGSPAEAEVEEDDRQDRDCSQAVQPWHIALSARNRFGHRTEAC